MSYASESVDPRAARVSQLFGDLQWLVEKVVAPLAPPATTPRVDSGVPAPSEPARPTTDFKFEKMQPGQSFVVPTRLIAQRAWQQARRLNLRITTRKQADGTIRVWYLGLGDGTKVPQKAPPTPRQRRVGMLQQLKPGDTLTAGDLTDAVRIRNRARTLGLGTRQRIQSDGSFLIEITETQGKQWTRK